RGVPGGEERCVAKGRARRAARPLRASARGGGGHARALAVAPLGPRGTPGRGGVGLPLPRARLVVVPLPGEGATARLSRGEAAHARARRLCEGDPVVLVDGSGREALAVLRRLGRGTAEVAVDSIRKAPPYGPPLALSVCGLRGERLAWLAEKATELSADRLT